jgi:hypothetical protein
MTGRPARPRRHLAMRALLDIPQGRAALLAAAPELPAALGRWLARLCLLYDLPFNTLVADARMLPAESVRFCYIDQNWLDALVDGALSVAAAAPPQATLTELRRPELQEAARVAAAELRAGAAARAAAGAAGAAGAAPGGPGEPEPPWSGLLLRSAAVAGWPGLEITAFSAADGTGPLPPLRIDRPAPSVLLAIFRGAARRFEISRPSQGLSFGVIRSGETARVAVRYIGGGPEFPAGEQPPRRPTVPAGFRDAARGVLDIQGLRTALEAELRSVYGAVQPPPLHPAALSIQLVAAPEWRAFVPDPAASTVPGGRDAG